MVESTSGSFASLDKYYQTKHADELGGPMDAAVRATIQTTASGLPDYPTGLTSGQITKGHRRIMIPTPIGGVIVGQTRGNGRSHRDVFGHVVDGFLSAHTTRVDAVGCGGSVIQHGGFAGVWDNLIFVSGFVGGYHEPTGLGPRLGGAAYLSPGRQAQDITSTLSEKEQAALEGKRRVRISYDYVRGGFLYLVVSVLQWLQALFRYDYDRTTREYYTTSMDPKSVPNCTHEHEHGLIRWGKNLWAAITHSDVLPSLDDPSALKIGDTLYHEYRTRHSMLGALGRLFANIGPQHTRMQQLNITVERHEARLSVEIEVAMNTSKALIGTIAGGLMAEADWSTPQSHRWTRDFALPDEQEAYCELIGRLKERRGLSALNKHADQAHMDADLDAWVGGNESAKYDRQVSTGSFHRKDARIRFCHPALLSGLGLLPQGAVTAFGGAICEGQCKVRSGELELEVSGKQHDALSGMRGRRQKRAECQVQRRYDGKDLAEASMFLLARYEYSRATPHELNESVFSELEALFNHSDRIDDGAPNIAADRSVTVKRRLHGSDLVRLGQSEAKVGNVDLGLGIAHGVRRLIEHVQACERRFTDPCLSQEVAFVDACAPFVNEFIQRHGIPAMAAVHYLTSCKDDELEVTSTSQLYDVPESLLTELKRKYPEPSAFCEPKQARQRVVDIGTALRRVRNIHALGENDKSWSQRKPISEILKELAAMLKAAEPATAS